MKQGSGIGAQGSGPSTPSHVSTVFAPLSFVLVVVLVLVLEPCWQD